MLFSAFIAAPPTRPLGPYATTSRVYTVPALDATGQRLHVFWPSNASTGEKFPLVPYLHGYLGGGLDILAYYDLFHDISSYGFVVAAPASCSTTCDDRIGLPYASCGGLPAGPDPYAGSGWTHRWSSYYAEGLKTIEFVRNASAAGDPVLRLVDEGRVGLAGHSMGGQAAAIAACAACARQWGIRAVALHHPAETATPVGGGVSNLGANVSVPLAAFTTSGDGCCESSTTELYDNATVMPRVLRDMAGSSHLEPLKVAGAYNPWLATHTAAWFKLYVSEDAGPLWHSLLYDSSDPRSLCRFAPQRRCETAEERSETRARSERQERGLMTGRGWSPSRSTIPFATSIYLYSLAPRWPPRRSCSCGAFL